MLPARQQRQRTTRHTKMRRGSTTVSRGWHVFAGMSVFAMMSWLLISFDIIS